MISKQLEIRNIDIRNIASDSALTISVHTLSTHNLHSLRHLVVLISSLIPYLPLRYSGILSLKFFVKAHSCQARSARRFCANLC